MLNLYVIGCGGIGSSLLKLLPGVIASSSMSVISKFHDIQYYLQNAGRTAIPCVIDSVTFVDADTFNARNAIRQMDGDGAGSKVAVALSKFRDNVTTCTWLQNIMFCGYARYVTPENMGEIIPRVAPVNRVNLGAWNDILSQHSLDIPFLGRSVPVVFLCVDNAKTRYEVSKYAETFDDIVVINGGNEYSTGHVTLYQRENGVALDPNIMDIYPNIRPDVDKRPDEIPCGAVAPRNEQCELTNNEVATKMLAMLTNYITNGTFNQVVRGSVKRRNEILIDTENYSATGVSHPLQ